MLGLGRWTERASGPGAFRHRQYSPAARSVRRQAGDTIVEVLMAIVVVSFVLVAAYVTANKNTLINQETQERAQANQLASTQLEFLHVSDVGSNYCFNSSGVPVGNAGDPTPCNVKSDGSQAASGDQLKYTIRITKPTAATYQVDVSWDRLNDATKGHVTLFYQP